MTLNEKVKLYIDNHGITQTFVANKLDISLKTLNGILLGRQRLSAEMLERICKEALQIDPSIFFNTDVLETKK